MSRVVIDLDDALMVQAKKLTGLSKKTDIVNYALEELIKRKHLKGILKLMGSCCWEGDLEEMRKGRTCLDRSRR